MSVRFRTMVVGAAVALMVVGTTQLRNAPVDIYPEFTPTNVQIQTEALGLSAAEVEQLITVPLEKDLLNGVPWLTQVRSESVPGLSSIDLIFEPGTEILKARQVVQERLSQGHALPNFGTPPVMIQPLSSTSRVMMIGLASKDLSLVDLSVLARWKIKPRLLGVPGVANVAIWGQRDRQLQVQVDPERLRRNGVTLNQIIDTAGNALWVSPLTFVQASTPGTGGFIDTTTQRFDIQHLLPITNARELSSVTIQDTTGRTLRLGDVTSVVEDHQPLIGDAVLSGGTGLMLVIQKFPEANTREVTQGIADALDALRPGLSGVNIDTNVYQADTFVQTALRNVGGLAIAGLILMLLLLALVLYSWRMALISFLTIAASLVASAYVLFLMGTSFNMMVLAGLAIALGVLIDESVVVVGSLRRRLREHRQAGSSSSLVEVLGEASSSLRVPLVYATLVLVLVPLPLLFLNGVAASFSRPAISAFVLSVLCATVVALTLTPALAYILLRNEPLVQRSSPLARLGTWLFNRVVAPFIRRPRWAYAIAALLLIGGLTLIPQLNGQLQLPAPQDRSLLIHWEAAPGTSLAEMARITTAVTGELRALAGVRGVAAHVGRAVASDQVVNVNSGELWVNLTDTSDYQSTVASVGRVLQGYPGLRSDLMTYGQDRIAAAETGSNDALVVRVYGQDLSILHTKAEELRQLISSVPGVVQPRVQALVEQPTLQVEVNLLAAQKYGLKPGDVRRTEGTFFAGLPVGNLYQDQKIFDVVVRGSPSTRYTPANFGDLLIDTPAGGQVRLGDIATVSIAPFPTIIKHDATSRSLDVTAGVSGRDLSSVLRDVKERIPTVQMPLEYHAEALSSLAKQQDQDLRTAGIAIAIAIGIFLLLQAAFNSWRLAAVVFFTLPLAVAGGVLAAFLVGGVTTLAALLGFVAVLAIAARNTVLLVRECQRRASVDGALHGAELVLRVTRDNAGHVLLTAAATAFAVLPLAVLSGFAGTEVVHPLATVILGGMVSSTLVTLFVVPALYLRVSRNAQSHRPGSPWSAAHDVD